MLVALLMVTAAVGGAAFAQSAPRELLNSERIAAAFGTYDIEVLQASPELRVSNLYSTGADGRTCRTFAVVLYPPAIDSAVAAEHATIVAGGSIGAVFAANGWSVRKTHLYYGERAASAKLAALMRVPVGTPLAEHGYVLDVEREGRTIEYAALLEIHHPTYLRLPELPSIYGRAVAGRRTALLERLLATGAGAAESP